MSTMVATGPGMSMQGVKNPPAQCAGGGSGSEEQYGRHGQHAGEQQASDQAEFQAILSGEGSECIHHGSDSVGDSNASMAYL
jgi:hypothetical protein